MLSHLSPCICDRRRSWNDSFVVCNCTYDSKECEIDLSFFFMSKVGDATSQFGRLAIISTTSLLLSKRDLVAKGTIECIVAS